MRIAIDTSPLANRHKLRGTGWYTRRLIAALQKFATQHEYILFEKKNQLKVNIDVVHFPYFEPFFLSLPLWHSLRTVVTVHDLIPLLFPDNFPKGVRGEMKWQIQRHTLRGVTSVITDSQASKKDIASLVSYPKERIFSIHLAASEEFGPKAKEKDLTKTRRRYMLPGQFFLYVGDLNYHKNVPQLFHAFSKHHQENNSSHLAIVGQAFLDNDLPEAREIRVLVKRYSLSSAVSFLGFVETEDLINLYNLATALVQTSLYEGFGLPLVEAMSCACPVIASDIPVYHEVCADVATYIDPKDPADISRKLSAVLKMGTKERQFKKQQLLKRATNFSWRQVAEETERIYRYVYSYGK